MIRQIKINAVLNGFIVTVGCQVVVFNTTREMLEAIEDYLNDPIEVEKTYRAEALNSDLLGDEETAESYEDENCEACEDNPPEPFLGTAARRSNV